MILESRASEIYIVSASAYMHTAGCEEYIPCLCGGELARFWINRINRMTVEKCVFASAWLYFMNWAPEGLLTFSPVPLLTASVCGTLGPPAVFIGIVCVCVCERESVRKAGGNGEKEASVLFGISLVFELCTVHTHKSFTFISLLCVQMLFGIGDIWHSNFVASLTKKAMNNSFMPAISFEPKTALDLVGHFNQLL